MGIINVHNVIFKIFGYSIWPRFNDIFYCNGLFLSSNMND